MRIIKRLQKGIPDDGGGGVIMPKREKSEDELNDARIMLNYIFHYP